MVGFVYLQVYNSIFNITEENNKFKLYKLPDEKAGGVSYEKFRDEYKKTWIFRILLQPIYKTI